MSNLKCNMKCFECIYTDCTQCKGITKEEREAIDRWLPDDAKSKKRKEKNEV
jgi:hypothetical protein